MSLLNIKKYRLLCQKNEDENYFFDKFFFRKFSIYFTILFIKLKISANTATSLSMISIVISYYYLVQNSNLAKSLSILFIALYMILDHVDGELARYYINSGKQKPSLMGGFYDVLLHQYSSNIFLFLIGMSIYDLFGYKIYIFIGFIACIGISRFPNLISSLIVFRKIILNPELLNSEKYKKILGRIELKKSQIEIIKNKNIIKITKKIIGELLIFPGVLFLIIIVLFLDIIFNSFSFFGYGINFRLIYLSFVTPFHLLKMVVDFQQNMSSLKDTN